MEGAVTRALLFDEDDVEGMAGGLPPVLSTDSTRGFDSPSLPVWERMGLWMMAAPTSVMYGWKHEALVKGEIPHADAGVAEPTNCPLKTSMSRMPHPRDHNGPQMLVMREESSSINECGGSSCVYEVQVHEPTGGFGCSWFVEDVVVPSHRLRHAYGGAAGSPEPRAVRAALLAFPESPSASTEKAPTLQVHPFLVATPLDGSYLVLGALMERYYPHAVRAGDDSSLTVEAPSPATKEKLDEALEAAVESLQRHSGSCRIPERFVPAEQLLIPLAPLTTTVAEEEAEVEEEEDDLLAAYRRSGSNGATSSLEHLPHHHHDDGVGESNRYAPWLNHRHLRRLCLVQTTADGAHYYQFSLVKAVRWVAGRVRRVARHPVLGELLGLPGRSGAVEEEAPRLRAALDLIAAYVSPLLLDLAALYLGVPNSKVKATVPPTAPHTSSMVSSTARGLPACPKQASAVQGTASDERRGPVSASVRRLEKSGRPKNTPTLFSLFAKKSPATKEDE